MAANLVKQFRPSMLTAAAVRNKISEGAYQMDYKTAVCFVPPRGFWNEPIQEIRCFNDKSFVRWPPHINFLYPFLAGTDENLKESAQKLRSCLSGFPPFKVSFKSFNLFNHGNTTTVWLDPESEELKRLHSVLVQEFPECTHLHDDPARGIKEFAPHLSVGQWPSQDAAEAAITRMSFEFNPFEIPVDNVVILRRRSYQHPFEFRYKIPLLTSSDDEVEELNTGYVASLGTSVQDCTEFPYGLGSSTEGIWHFMYGPDMHPAHLLVSRNITPLESIGGLLHGYKLSFNHHGGMGNVEPMNPGSRTYFQSRGIYGVHGVLHRLSLVDTARITNMNSRCRPVEMNVITSDGRGVVKAIVFTTPGHQKIRDDLPPTEKYHHLTLEAARKWELSEEYIKWLESLATVPAHNRGPLYWRNSNGKHIRDRIIRVGSEQTWHKRKS